MRAFSSNRVRSRSSASVSCAGCVAGSRAGSTPPGPRSVRSPPSGRSAAGSAGGRRRAGSPVGVASSSWARTAMARASARSSRCVTCRRPAGPLRPLTAHRFGQLPLGERPRPVPRPVAGVQVGVVQLQLDEPALEQLRRRDRRAGGRLHVPLPGRLRHRRGHGPELAGRARRPRRAASRHPGGNRPRSPRPALAGWRRRRGPRRSGRCPGDCGVPPHPRPGARARGRGSSPVTATAPARPRR